MSLLDRILNRPTPDTPRGRANERLDAITAVRLGPDDETDDAVLGDLLHARTEDELTEQEERAAQRAAERKAFYHKTRF